MAERLVRPAGGRTVTDRCREQTVELDTVVMDSSDIANIGLHELAEALVEVGGEPNDAGMMPSRVRVFGTVTIEEVDKHREDNSE